MFVTLFLFSVLVSLGKCSLFDALRIPSVTTVKSTIKGEPDCVAVRLSVQSRDSPGDNNVFFSGARMDTVPAGRENKEPTEDNAEEVDRADSDTDDNDKGDSDRDNETLLFPSTNNTCDGLETA